MKGQLVRNNVMGRYGKPMLENQKVSDKQPSKGSRPKQPLHAFFIHQVASHTQIHNYFAQLEAAVPL